ncbi:MAG: alanine racemase [Enterovibrio sp.]
MKIATAVIDKQAFAHNVAIVRAKASSQQVWAMVKANGYGHGLVPSSQELCAYVDGFGVARVAEAKQLRHAGIQNPILLLEGFFCAQELPQLAKYHLQTVVHCEEQLLALESSTLAAPVVVWLKIDTGMHRLGVRPEQASEFIARLNACANVQKPLHFISHLGCADEPENPITHQQLDVFSSITHDKEGLHSLAASAGILSWPKTHLDVVRPGIMLYGVSPFQDKIGPEIGLKPVMTMTSSLIAVRVAKQGEAIGYGATWQVPEDTLLGVVAMGYGDGYPRCAPAGTPVWVNGRRVPLVGRVSMDMLMVDLGAHAQDSVGDEVILWGEPLPVEEVAAHIGTIGYELVTNITSRVALVYR